MSRGVPVGSRIGLSTKRRKVGQIRKRRPQPKRHAQLVKPPKLGRVSLRRKRQAARLEEGGGRRREAPRVGYRGEKRLGARRRWQARAREEDREVEVWMGEVCELGSACDAGRVQLFRVRAALLTLGGDASGRRGGGSSRD